jgi:predicted KAP-like P-loop ATPase
LIKSVADFPNTIYLITFDREIVSKALSEDRSWRGDAYLEKIIQVSFELPIPSRESLRRMLTERLDIIISHTPDVLFDSYRWQRMFENSVDHYLRTPRDAVRLANTLSVTYSAVDGEVNVVDFIAIEALRTFVPTAYDAIRNHRAAFVGPGRGDSLADYMLDTSGWRRFHEEWLATIDQSHRVAVEATVKNLFPYVEKVMGGASYGGDWQPRWRRELRICAPEHFPTYFRLALSSDTLSFAELDAFLELSSDSALVARELRRLSLIPRSDGMSRATSLLLRLNDLEDDAIPVDAVRELTVGLCEVGDELLEREPAIRGFLTFRSDDFISRLVLRLVLRLPARERFRLIDGAFNHGAALSTIIEIFTDIAGQHGRFRENPTELEPNRLLSETQLDRVQRRVLAKIKKAATGGLLADVPRLQAALRVWALIDSPKRVQKWVKDYIGSDDHLIRFLAAFESIVDTNGRSSLYLDPRSFRLFVDPESLARRVHLLMIGARLSDEDTRVLKKSSQKRHRGAA